LCSEKLKEILMLDSNTLVEYKFHANSIRDMSTFRNAKPYVFAAATPATTNSSHDGVSED